jgi:hypothetical protein
VTVTGAGDAEGEGAGVGAVVGAGTGAVVGAGSGAVVGTVAGAVVGAGAVLNVGAVDAGVDGAVAGTPTEEEVPATAAGWAAAGRDATEPAEVCMGTEPEPVVVVLGRAVGVAAGIPAGLWTARGRYA